MIRHRVEVGGRLRLVRHRVQHHDRVEAPQVPDRGSAQADGAGAQDRQRSGAPVVGGKAVERMAGHRGRLGQRRDVRPHPGGDGDGVVGGNGDVLGHRPAAGEIDADYLLVQEARIAFLRVRSMVGDDVVQGDRRAHRRSAGAGTQRRDAGADLVSHDHVRRPPAALTGEAVHVAAADADRVDRQQHFPVARFGLRQIDDAHRPRLLVQDRFHEAEHSGPCGEAKDA